jgi:hypothetical protein
MLTRNTLNFRWALGPPAHGTGGAKKKWTNLLVPEGSNRRAETIAAWPRWHCCGTIELVSRVPVHPFLLAAPRVLPGGHLGIPAWVSYWQMAGVTARLTTSQ